MKKNTFTFLLFFLSVIIVYSQSIIKNPKTGLSLCNYVKITKLKLTDSTTILYFHTYNTPGEWILIPKETYIQPVGSEKLFIKRAEGITLNDQYTMPASGEVSYVLTFPAIPKTTRYIDYGEANEGGSWFIYDIQTKPMDSKSGLPKELSGNWFDKSTGNWELGFFDKYIVYKNKVWSYDFTKNEKALNSVKLKNNGKSVELFYKTASGTILIGESAQSLKEYSNNFAEAKKKKPIDDKPYELPVFKIDSATYSGYIKGYTPRFGIKTLSISINDIIAGDHNSFVIKIDENGFFSAKLPVYYPHVCYVRSSVYDGWVFLEPGKELFQLMGDSDPTLFMGESARINSDMPELEKIRSFNYSDMRSKILDMTPVEYKTYCMNCGNKDMNALDSIMATNTISAKAYQVMKLEFKYRAEETIMSYNMNFRNAYRQKNNVPDSLWTSIKTDSLTADYFDFINNESANNPFTVLSSSYDTYINRLKYLDILGIGSSFTMTTTAESLVADLEKSGYVFTESEKIIIRIMKRVDSLQNSTEEKNYYDKYGKRISEFFVKYQDILQDIFKANPRADERVIYKYFEEKNIKLTPDEKKLREVMLEHDKSNKAYYGVETTYNYGDSTLKFLHSHDDFLNGLYNELYYQKRNETRNEKMKKLFGVEPGLASDIMVAQDNCHVIVQELAPVDSTKLKKIQRELSTPFIVDYVALCNNRSIAKLESYKKIPGGSIVNEVPKTDADKVFDAIIEKYKGKVVYVDFWATWCGPCRSGIKQIIPLKGELDGQDIVFVYITDQSSPQSTWSKLIPDIKGEHYRVSTDEWNFLTAKFNIYGIPHYVLVGKNGEIINSNLGHFENERLKSELTKYINE